MTFDTTFAIGLGLLAGIGVVTICWFAAGSYAKLSAMRINVEETRRRMRDVESELQRVRSDLASLEMRSARRASTSAGVSRRWWAVR